MSVTRDIRSVAALAIAAVLLLAAVPVNGQTVIGAEAVQKYNADPLTVAIPPTFGPQEVEEIMVLALNGRKWTVVQQSPQEVVGTLDHRNFQAKVMLRVDGNVIKIVSDSLYKSPHTGALEPGIPKGWLKNLAKDMNARFATTAARK